MLIKISTILLLSRSLQVFKCIRPLPIDVHWGEHINSPPGILDLMYPSNRARMEHCQFPTSVYYYKNCVHGYKKNACTSTMVHFFKRIKMATI